jgi:hypothetical protein
MVSLAGLGAGLLVWLLSGMGEGTATSLNLSAVLPILLRKNSNTDKFINHNLSKNAAFVLACALFFFCSPPRFPALALGLQGLCSYAEPAFCFLFDPGRKGMLCSAVSEFPRTRSN